MTPEGGAAMIGLLVVVFIVAWFVLCVALMEGIE